MPLSLTSHLLTISPDAYLRATQHPFLRAAGDQSISKERLEQWLAQDKIYAFVGYPKFISLLTSRVPLSVSVANLERPENNGPGLEERILSLLSFSLSNIVQEIKFFNKTAQENGLDLAKRPRSDLSVENDLTRTVTKAYTDFMISTAATGSLCDGLVVLWATELCYLEAWTYARSHMTATAPSTSAGVARALGTFIHNWTTKEFRIFVDQIGSLLNEYAANASAREYEELKERAEQIWRWCLWYEEKFWDGE